MKDSLALALTLLRRHPDGLTRGQAFLLGCGNLPGRVLELKAAGYDIRDWWVATANGARIKAWRLIEAPRQLDLFDPALTAAPLPPDEAVSGRPRGLAPAARAG